MKVEIKDNTMIITIEIEKPRLSASGKTYVVASTGGFRPSTAEVNGKPVSINLNAVIKK